MLIKELAKLIKEDTSNKFKGLDKLNPDGLIERKKIVAIIDKNDADTYASSKNYEKIRPVVIDYLRQGFRKLSF